MKHIQRYSSVESENLSRLIGLLRDNLQTVRDRVANGIWTFESTKIAKVALRPE